MLSTQQRAFSMQHFLQRHSVQYPPWLTSYALQERSAREKHQSHDNGSQWP